MSSFTLTDYKWNWIDDGLLPYALAAMRATWVGLLVHLWSRGTMPYRPDLVTPLIAFGLLAASIACTQLGVYVIKTTWRAVALVVLSGLIAIALTLYLGIGAARPLIWEMRWLTLLVRDPGATIITVLIAVWLWWGGIRTGREHISYDSLTADFSWGVLMLAVGATTAYATRVIPLLQVLLACIPFFAIGLATIAIANLQSARRFEGSRTDQALAVNRYWLGTVVVVIGAVLLAGLLLSQLFTPGAIEWVLARLAVVFDWLSWLLLAVIVVVTYPLFKLLEWLARLVHLEGAGELPPINPPPSIAEQFEDLQPGQSNLPPQVYAGLQVLAVILSVAVIVLIFALAFRRFKALMQEDVEETREIIFSMDLLKEQLAQLFGRKGKANGVEPEPFVSIAGDDARSQIRHVYQALLAWAASRNLSRRPGLTPAEYSLWLSDRLLDYREPVAVITRIYQQARYSIAPIPATSVEEVVHAWALIAAADVCELDAQ